MNIVNTGPIPLKKKPTVEGKKASNPIADAISKIATAAPKTPLQLARGEIMPEGYNITAKRNPGTLEGAMAEWDRRNPNASLLQRDTVKYKLQAFLIDGPKTQAGWRAKRAGDLLAAYEADQMELHRIGAEREFNQASAMALSDIGAGIDERVAGVVPGSGTVSQFSRGVVKGIMSFVNPVDQAAMLYQTSNAIDQPELFGDLAKGLARPLTVWFDPSATAEEKGMAMAQLALIAAPLGAKGFPRIKAAIKNMGVSEAKAYATMERLAGELLKNPKTASVGKALKRTLAEEPPPVSFEDKTPKVTFRRKQDAVQIEEPNESVLRQEGQELELQKVGEGNQGPQKPAGKGKKGKEKEVGGKTAKPGRGRKPAQEKTPQGSAAPVGQPESGISLEAKSRIDDLVQAELARMDKTGQTPMPKRTYETPPASVSIDLLTIDRARKTLADPALPTESRSRTQADLIGAERRVAEWGEQNGWGEIKPESFPEQTRLDTEGEVTSSSPTSTKTGVRQEPVASRQQSTKVDSGKNPSVEPDEVTPVDNTAEIKRQQRAQMLIDLAEAGKIKDVILEVVPEDPVYAEALKRIGPSLNAPFTMHLPTPRHEYSRPWTAYVLEEVRQGTLTASEADQIFKALSGDGVRSPRLDHYTEYLKNLEEAGRLKRERNAFYEEHAREYGDSVGIIGSDGLQRMLADGKYIPDNILNDYKGEPWADAEIARRAKQAGKDAGPGTLEPNTQDEGVSTHAEPQTGADGAGQPSIPAKRKPKTANKSKGNKAGPEEPEGPDAATMPETMEIEVGGKKYTISGKQINEYMKAKAAYEATVSSIKRTAGLTPQEAASARKAAGMKFSAEKRRIVGASTLKEQAARTAEANSVKSGDTVTTKDGVTGRVKSNAFGKVVIETENGPVTVKRSDIVGKAEPAGAGGDTPANTAESPEQTAPLRGRSRIEAAREARNARIRAELEAEGKGEKPTELQAGPKISKEDFDYLKEIALGILEEVGDNFRAFVGDIRDNGEKWDIVHLKKAWRESGGTINPSLGGRQEQIRANQEAAGLPISEKSPQTGLLSATEAVGEKNYRTEAGQAKVKEQLARIKDGKAPDVSVETQGLMVAHLKNCKIALRRAKAELAKNPKSKALQEAVAKAEADFAEATMAHFLTREESGRTVVVGKIGEPIDWANPEDILQEATINAGKRGKKLSNKEIAEAEAMAKRVAEAEAEVAKAKEAAKQAWDEVAKMKEAKYSKRPPKKRFNSLEDFIKNGGKLVQGKTLAGEAGAARAPVDIPTSEASYHIWQHVKKNYLDKGEYNLEHIADGVVKDLEALGRTVDREYVKRAIGSPKTVRDLTTETLVKQAKERAVLRTAKAYVENAGKTPVEKLVKKVWDFPRGMLATADNSVAFTQGARRFWTNPIKASSEIKASYKMFGSEAYHEYVMQNLERRDNLGLYVYGKLDALPSVLEEQAGYMHPLEGIPGIGKIVRMSDRAFDAAKLMRANWFDELISKYPPEQRLSVAKEIASQVNAMTGRQSIGTGTLAKSVQFATFAAKLEASRWRFLFLDPAVAVKKLVAPTAATDRQMATMMLKNMAKFYGTLGTALAVNKILNHDVNIGVDENTKSWKDVVKNIGRPDFANFKAFGIRIDASGGLFGPLRLMARELVSYWDQREGKPQYQSGSDIAARYLRGKSHPAVATIADLWAGTDYIGKPLPHATDRQKASARKRGLAPYTWAGYASTKTIPLTPQQAYQTFNEELKKNGVDGSSREALVKTFMSFVAEFNGLRTNKDYEQKETAKTSRKIYK